MVRFHLSSLYNYIWHLILIVSGILYLKSYFKIILASSGRAVLWLSMWKCNDEDKEKQALLCLTILDDDINEVYDSNLSSSGDEDEINDLYSKLYNSLVKVKKELKNTLVENKSLLEKNWGVRKAKWWYEYLILLLENKSYNQLWNL